MAIVTGAAVDDNGPGPGFQDLGWALGAWPNAVHIALLVGDQFAEIHAQIGSRLGIERHQFGVGFCQPVVQRRLLGLSMRGVLQHQAPLGPDHLGGGVRIRPDARHFDLEALTHGRFVGHLIR